MDKKEEILNLISLYIEEKNKNKKWTPGEDWIQYSGPYFDSKEYTAAVDSLLSGWLILGEKGREFEKKFSRFLGKNDGILVNSGSSANLLMVSLFTSFSSNFST